MTRTKLERIFLHVGPPKTGTTVLQSTLFENRDHLISRRCLYPDVRPGPASKVAVHYDPTDRVKHDGVSLFAFDHPSETQYAKRLGLTGELLDDWIADGLKSLEAQIETSSARVMILSSEGFGNFALAKGSCYRQLATFLQGYATDVQVILYARHPIAMIRSRYQHYLRVGAATLEELNDTPWCYPYQQEVAQLRAAFGTENVAVRCYRRDFDRSFDIVTDFGTAVGLGDVNLKRAERRMNESVSMESALLMDVVAREFPQPSVMVGVRHPQRGGIPRNIAGAPFRLAPALEQATRKMSAQDCRFLEREFGIVFPDLEGAEMESLWGAESVRSLALTLNHQTLTIQRLSAKIAELEGQGRG